MATRVAASERGLIAAPIEEQPALAELERLLTNESSARLTLVAGDGKSIEVPESALRLLRQAIHDLTRDQAVAVVCVQKNLTTQQAADILNVSRPYLIKLLEEGALPFTKTGTHRRVQFDDVIAYKVRRDRDRRHAMDTLVQLTEEYGLYEDDAVAGPPRIQ